MKILIFIFWSIFCFGLGYLVRYFYECYCGIFIRKPKSKRIRKLIPSIETNRLFNTENPVELELELKKYTNIGLDQILDISKHMGDKNV